MGVTVDVLSRKYNFQLSNGDTFALNPGNFSNHFSGGVMEKVRATLEVQVFTLTQLQAWTFKEETGTDGLILQDSTDFADEGFFPGDTVILRIGVTVPATTGEVKFAGDGELRLINMTNKPAEADYAGDSAEGDWLKSDKQLDALAYSFGLIEQEENVNYISKITETEQTWLIDQINPGPEEGVPKGASEVRGWVSGRASCEFIETREDYKIPIGSPNDDTVFIYEVEQDFIILPYYLNGELPNLANLVPPDLYKGQPTLRHVTRYDFRDALNNPNTSKTGEDDLSLGSIGWFNESFNGFPVRYELESIAYEVNGSEVFEIQAGQTTNVTIVINSLDAKFTAGQTFVVYHSILPGLNTYKFSKDNFSDTWIYDAVRGVQGNTESGSPLENVEASQTAGVLTITFDVVYTQAQLDRIADSENYILAVCVADDSLDVNDSDKITVLCDFNQINLNSDIPGLIEFNELAMYAHGQTQGGSTPTEDGIFWDEDGVLVQYGFDLNSDEQAVLEELEINIIAYNETTGESFIIQQNAVDLSSGQYTNDVLSISIDERRGFLIPVDDQFNWNKLEK